MGRVSVFSFIKSNSCRRRLPPLATRSPRLLSICFFFIQFLCIFLLSSVSYAFEDNIEKDLQKSLEQSRTIIVTIQNKLHLATRNAQLVSNASITPEITQLRAVADNIRVSHLLLDERFTLREEKARSLGSKAQERHKAMFEGYREAIEEYLAIIDGLPADSQLAAGTTQPATRELVTRNTQLLLDLLSRLLPKKRRPIIGSLPYKHLNYPAIEPTAAPAITPAYKGGNKTVSPEDTAGAPLAPVSKEIATLAQSLNWNPVSIYEYVKNNVETEWYWGCMKGAEETLRQKSGNDCDQAALLAALLRASEFPTRYVRGVIEFFPDIEKAKNLTGIDDPWKIAEFLQKAGIPYKTVIAGGRIANIRIEHVWVESQIPYANYRGAIIDEHGKTWLGLDTSIKVKDYVNNNPKDIMSELSLSTVRDDYLRLASGPQPATPLEYLQSYINSELATRNSQLVYSDFIRTRTLSPEHMKILPASMQFTEAKITNEYTTIPDELIHKARFLATRDAQLATPLFDITIPLYKLSNQQIAITYEPETVEDQEIINSYGGLDNTPSYLVRLRPVLKVNGERIVVAQDGLPMGSEFDLAVELRGTGSGVAGSEPIEKIINTLIVGNLSVIGIAAQRAVTTPSPSGGEGEGEGEKDAELLLYEAGQHYIDRWNQAEDELASLLHLEIARPLATVVTVGGVIDVTYLLDMPHGFTWKGVFVDADHRSIETVTRTQSTDDRQKLFMQLSSLQGSILENRIFEDDFQVEAISTAKLFQLATSQLVTNIITIDKTNITTIFPTLSIEDNVKEDITNSVNQNFTIRIPQSEITYQNWWGVGYIKENQETGESGWMLSGMIAGGMTAWGVDLWPDYYRDRLTNPYSEPPNYDPASAQNIQKLAYTDMQKETVGTRLLWPLMVKVTDQKGNPVKNAEVAFTVKAGGGKLIEIDPLTKKEVEKDTIFVKTGSTGVAPATFRVGTETKANSIYGRLSTTEDYYTQIGENIIEAALKATGITTPKPFTAYGVPGKPDHMRPLAGDKQWGFILSMTGFISAAVEDKYNNPISNLPVRFQTGLAKENTTLPQCTTPNQDPRNYSLITTTSDPCMKNTPTWNDIENGACTTVASSITEKAARDGAQVQVFLGGIPAAIYPIEATCTDPQCIDPKTNKPLVTTTFNLYSYAFGNCDGTAEPSNKLYAEYSFAADSYGNTINAGKVGTIIPLQASLHFIKEGATEADETLSCSSGAKTCKKLIGNRQYSIATDFKASSAKFTAQDGTVKDGTPQGNGVFTSTHTLALGPNTLTIDGTATIGIRKAYNTCAGCTIKNDDPLTQTAQIAMQVFGVDIQTGPVPVILVDEKGYAKRDTTITYTILPLDSPYTASTAYVMIYKNGTYIAAIPTEKKGKGTATLVRGFWFDVSSTYEAEVVLNYGTGAGEIRSGKARLTISVLHIEFIDKDGNTVTTAKIGEDENFVSWKTLEIKYKLTPALADSEYNWEVVKGTATTAGHAGLGTSSPESIIIDKTGKIIKFAPKSTGSYKYNYATKAKPLTFDLRFKLNNQVTDTFKIQQNDRNAIREEYKVYETPESYFLSNTDFDKALENKYHVACPYDAADVPRGAKLNKLGGLLPEGKYSITNSYRNPYKNDQAGSNSAKSSHVWSGAFDLNAADGTTVQLKELRDNIISKTEFGQVYLESSGTKSDPDLIKRFLEDYIKVNLKKAIVDGSLTYSLPCGAETYSIVWSKASNCGVVGWKTVAFSWKETESQQVPTPGEYIFKEGDWDIIARNLHVQDKISDKWGFEP